MSKYLMIRRAIEDDIPFEDLGYEALFFVTCAKCGKKIKRFEYKRNKVYVCHDCLTRAAKEKRVAELSKHADVFTKEDIRFFDAKAELEMLVPDISLYEAAIEKVYKSRDRFGSIPEVLAAFELVRLGHKVIPQQPVGRYRVDFVLPDLKLAVEVDGVTYHHSAYERRERDARILRGLGFGWVIIHVPAEEIRKDILKVQSALDIGRHQFD